MVFLQKPLGRGVAELRVGDQIEFLQQCPLLFDHRLVLIALDVRSAILGGTFAVDVHERVFLLISNQLRVEESLFHGLSDQVDLQGAESLVRGKSFNVVFVDHDSVPLALIPQFRAGLKRYVHHESVHFDQGFARNHLPGNRLLHVHMTRHEELVD